MGDETRDLDGLQRAYKAAVDAWVAAIRAEEALASVNHTVAEVDRWEGAHFLAEEARARVEGTKANYEGALRKKFFHFQ